MVRCKVEFSDRLQPFMKNCKPFMKSCKPFHEKLQTFHEKFPKQAIYFCWSSELFPTKKSLTSIFFFPALLKILVWYTTIEWFAVTLICGTAILVSKSFYPGRKDSNTLGTLRGIISLRTQCAFSGLDFCSYIIFLLVNFILICYPNVKPMPTFVKR